MVEEHNSRTKLPAQIDMHAVTGNENQFFFQTKGGGCASKTFLFQQPKALSNEKSLTRFFEEKIRVIGTSACPPYHLAVVVGGTSAEVCLHAVKLAAAGFYDQLPTTGNESGRAFRDLEWENRIEKICQDSGIGGQFGGKYLVLDVKVIRLPRHAASCPIGIGVSCSADRNVKAKITEEGIFLEVLEKNPEQFLPANAPGMVSAIEIDLREGMDKVRSILTQYPIKTRLNIRGELIVMRDMAHSKLKELIDNGGKVPDYMKDFPIYSAGPAKAPEGMA
jgi:fumarate hydratase class I